MAANRFFKNWFASGEPWIWMNAAAVGISVSAVVGILLLIAIKGFAHFWPSDVALIEFRNEAGVVEQVFGELVELDEISVEQFVESGGPNDWVDAESDVMARWLVKTGNRRVNPPDFRWLYENQIDSLTYPEGVTVLERVEWGNAYGNIVSLSVDGQTDHTPEFAQLAGRLDFANGLREEIDSLEQGELNHINYEIDRLRLERRSLELSGQDTLERMQEIDAAEAQLRQDYQGHEQRLRELYAELALDRIEISNPAHGIVDIELADVLHAWQPNDLGSLAKLSHYFSGIWRFLTEDPREANTEGGIYPAIFGTILMVLLMSVVVTPFGVVAAVYLREYAKQGPFVRIIRIAVNNLAGVPSIVYGVFGLGFFVYFLGGNIDRLFYPEALPAPTFGTPGLVWAALTLALLTVPVVIVSTEEGLTRIPRSLREGSLALGATKAETLFRVILPMASPSILTGVILAVARAAGEVAPLMLVGVVKLAPTLPLDGNFPFLHLDRKFMHLGFHIYDVGFQSPNVEAARPLVYATALLLVIIIVGLNLTAITLRGRLEQRYKGVES